MPALVPSDEDNTERNDRIALAIIAFLIAMILVSVLLFYSVPADCIVCA